MINHARTLLLNEHAADAGDIIVPVSFIPAPLTNDVLIARENLLGNPESLEERLENIHRALFELSVSPLAEYLYSRDSRITYDEDYFPQGSYKLPGVFANHPPEHFTPLFSDVAIREIRELNYIFRSSRLLRHRAYAALLAVMVNTESMAGRL